MFIEIKGGIYNMDKVLFVRRTGNAIDFEYDCSAENYHRVEFKTEQEADELIAKITGQKENGELNRLRAQIKSLQKDHTGIQDQVIELVGYVNELLDRFEKSEKSNG